MNVLLEIGHPAHAHFFRPVIHKLESGGGKVVVVTRNKEITDRLLAEMGIHYTSLSTPADGKAAMLVELFRRWFAIWRILGRENIDVAASISGISTAVPARLRGIPNITITDTEDARLTNAVAFPFSDFILTPDFFLRDLGGRHIRYFGLHESAYLKAFDFNGLDSRLAELGLALNSYFIIRLIAYDAAHDWRLTQATEEEILAIVHDLEKHCAVYVCSQRRLPPALSQYNLKTPITRIHDVLAGARGFIGESPTMAVEAGLLGAPSFLVSGRSPHLGNMIELEKRGLLRNLACFSDARSELSGIADWNKLREQWKARAREFLNGTIDVPDYIVESLKRAAEGKRPSNAPG